MFTPLPINESIGACVDSVSDKLLTQLQEEDSNIQALSFMYGHPLELISLLKKKSEDPSARYSKFPCIMLFADVNQQQSSVKGLPYDVSLNMVIAMSNSKPDMEASQRISTKFVPILRPIYQQLIEEIFRSGFFHLQNTNLISGYSIERLFWGRESLGGNDANKLNDYIDAIEIRGMKLTPTMKDVIYVSSVQKVWRTVVLNIVASPARPASVTYPIDEDVFVRVGGGKLMYKQYAPGNTLKPLCFGESTGYMAGKSIELPLHYSDIPQSLIDYSATSGEWDNTENNGFSEGAYLTIKFLDNV